LFFCDEGLTCAATLPLLGTSLYCVFQVAQSRKKADEEKGAGASAQLPRPTSLDNIRGRCSLCNNDVLDTQPRQKDPTTGLYQHEACCSAGTRSADRAHVATLTTQASVVVSNSTTSSMTAEQATAAVATAAAEVQIEVAAIMAAADAARAEAIAQATQQAQAAVAQAQADAAQIVAAAAMTSAVPTPAPTPVASPAIADDSVSEVTPSLPSISASTQPAPSILAASAPPTATCSPTKPRTKPVFPTATMTPMLLPDGKHAFLSYQWDVQAQVVQIKELLNERNVKCWMDIDGGMKADIYDSVSA
jgi:hypothetical protein